jgi:predicted SAM-dependent methyltransferase
MLIVGRPAAFALLILAIVILGETVDWGRELIPSGEPAASDAQPSVPADPLATFKQESRATIEAYLRDQAVKRLQIGAGGARHEGWLNTDIEPGEGLAYLDATKPFPFPDGTFQYVASEHVIEHLTYEEGKAMIAESFRVLAPGGKVRIATPNLMRLIALFDKNRSDEANGYIAGKLAWHEWPKETPSEAIILNFQMSSWGHKFLYDPATLRAGLARAGFTQIKQFAMSESDDPVLEGFEARITGVHAQVNAYETMVLQGQK